MKGEDIMYKLSDLFMRYPVLKNCRESLEAALDAMITTYRTNKKILLCGNGGSAADCDHIAGELLKGFLSKREVNDPSLPQDLRDVLQGSLPAISLPSITAAMTAAINDLDPAYAYAQLLYGLAQQGDLLIAISTSGNAENVYHAARLAKTRGITVLALTGQTGGKLSSIADVCICVPEDETYKIQELHLPIYHFLCAAVEEEFFE